MNIIFDENGVADVYDDTYDIVIHCESEEDQKNTELALKNTRRWIPVTESLPEEGDEFYPMNIVTAENGEIGFGVYRWDDGAWYVRLTEGDEHYETGYKVIAWMPLPEPYREEQDD